MPSEGSNYPTCPCCGSEVSPVDLLIDEARKTVTFREQTAKLTPSQLRLFRGLVDRYPTVATKEQCLAALCGHQHVDDWPEIKIVDIQVCHMRKRLDPLGIAITTSWGAGYGLEIEESEAVAALRARRFAETRNVKLAASASDLPTIRMLRTKGYSLIEIGRRLKMTFKAVTAAVDQIAAEDAQRLDLTRAA